MPKPEEQLRGAWFLIASTHPVWRAKSHVTLDFEPGPDEVHTCLRFKQRNLFGTRSVRVVEGRDRWVEGKAFAWHGDGSSGSWTLACMGPRRDWHVAHLETHRIASGAAVEIFARGPTLPQSQLDAVTDAIRGLPALRAAALGMVAVTHDHHPPVPYRFGL